MVHDIPIQKTFSIFEQPTAVFNFIEEHNFKAHSVFSSRLLPSISLALSCCLALTFTSAECYNRDTDVEVNELILLCLSYDLPIAQNTCSFCHSLSLLLAVLLRFWCFSQCRLVINSMCNEWVILSLRKFSFLFPRPYSPHYVDALVGESERKTPCKEGFSYWIFHSIERMFAGVV